MLKEVVASKAAKLIAACICPVAGTTALTVSVPEVRQAVHRVTAPKAKAKPRVAVRRAPARAQAVAVCPQPADTPVVLASAALPGASVLPPLQLAALPAPQSGPPLPHYHRLPEGPFAFLVPNPGSTIIVPPGPPSPPPVIPEPRVWLQLLIGFGVIGGATRSIYRRQARGEPIREPAR